MSKTFSLDLKKNQIYKVEHNGLEVTIEPLNKRDDKKLTDKFTKGKVSILQSKTKKGFRAKNEDKDEIVLPEIDYIGLNIEKAKKTWKNWNLTFNESPIPCDGENIELLFNNYYDQYAAPILDKLEDMIDEGEEEKGKP